MVQDASLANLQPGNRKGTRNKITKAVALKLADFVEDDWDTFVDEMGQLPLRDRVATKLKLLQLLLPKQLEVDVEAIDTTKKKWGYREVIPATLPEPETSAEVVEPEAAPELPAGDPSQLTLDFTPEPAAAPKAPRGRVTIQAAQ